MTNHYREHHAGRKARRRFLQIYPELARKDPGADMPVPDRLLPKWKAKWLVNRLKLSQMIGLLLYLNREELLSSGGQERLLYLQAKAPFSAIAAGLEFARRLEKEKKLISDFGHQLIELNRRPQSKRFRRYEVSRIGVGYRDKGTLPAESDRARRKADQENFVFLADLPAEMQSMMMRLFPNSVEGEWLDLNELDLTMKIEDLSPSDHQLLFHR